MWFSLLQVWTFQELHTVETAVISQGSGPLLWLVKRNQVRLPERFGPLQPATAGLAKPSPWRKRREEKISCYSLPYKKQFWFCHCSLRLSGRKKKGENLGSKEVMGLMLNMQNPLPWHPQPQPCARLSTTMVMLRLELGPSLYQPGAEHDTQETGLLLTRTQKQ